VRCHEIDMCPCAVARPFVEQGFLTLRTRCVRNRTDGFLSVRDTGVVPVPPINSAAPASPLR
jgi:hypothetical protein